MTEADAIMDFIVDHWEQFGCYPMEVETDSKLYSWDEYWQILEREGRAW